MKIFEENKKNSLLKHVFTKINDAVTEFVIANFSNVLKARLNSDTPEFLGCVYHY